jgi:ABC-type branched-subunit amino acid transport system substrate-binding protein
VFLTADPERRGDDLRTAAKLGFAPRWIGQSASWAAGLSESPLAPYLEKNVWIASEGTEWGDEKVPGMKQMVADVEKYAPEQEPDYYFAFGYNAATAMTALLEKAVEMGDLSKDGMKKAIDQLGTVSFNGLAGDYQYGANGDRNPPRESTIFEVDPDKPFSLGTLEYNYKSPAAEEFEFKLQGS